MRLEHPMLGIFLEAMEESLDSTDLQVILLQRFALRYASLTNVMLPWSLQVIQVHDYFHRRDQTEQLVTALRDARSSVPEFTRVADSMGFAAGTSALEVLVRRGGTPYQDVDAFRAKLATIEAAVCQVDVDGAVGTGTLIGDDLIITNRHVVVARIADDGNWTGPVTCRFDYKTNGNGYTTPPVEVKAVALLAASPHAPQDTMIGPMATDLQALDYAILRLDRKLASAPVVAGGELRGSVAVDGANAASVNAGVLVIQHPGGKPMKIDLGSVTETGPARFRHTVNTEPGSSGAPVFDAALNLIGIHHAGQSGGPGPALTYNEGIPLGAILTDARAKQVAI